MLATARTPSATTRTRGRTEFAFLNLPGHAEIQAALLCDYRTNVAAYPAWQAWLRAHRPRTLVMWGRYDSSFVAAAGAAYQRDLPDAEVHLLDAGHFALDENVDEIAALMHAFLAKHLRSRSSRP
ncbi:alpha/beta fold hydrolase [Paraburkholderia sp. CNPSo 3281]|uniref:alpha/beta fold hydrolase n=1 Tax=Paraburkholderia sp. CNPSo 3281 TaxID=2940933 RepID=UPI0020B8131D|nr:alpha/beta hydrolase [Paraburkholderia sp. CNPSo 3281]MCP3718991.1 alpha/beta hydrolase [Paraburkholderia sp. CNPSo 3281]